MQVKQQPNQTTVLGDCQSHVSSSSTPVNLTFKNLNYGIELKNNHLDILKNLNGIFKSGTMTGILAASGGGKTSLLNVLSGKINSSNNHVKLSGEIKANGNIFTNDEFNKFSGYVMQNDILIESLTVRECIQFAADFKLSGTEAFKLKQVQDMIHELKLTKCQNTLIGGTLFKGISGGERKRVNIGCELITNPSVLFLDEPTSGLDSFTAFIVISILKEFAEKRNKTVIMSIHQPNADTWGLFDKVILLVQGQAIFQGNRYEIIDYFKEIGFECPKNTCPADFLMKHMTQNEINSKKFGFLFEIYNKNINEKILSDINSIEKTEITLKDTTTGFWFQSTKIARRAFLVMKRNPLLLKSRIIQNIIIGIFIGLVFLNQEKIHHTSSLTEVQNKIGVLFLCAMSTLLQSLNAVILSFPAERLVFLKEENSKYYSTLAYLTGKLSLEYLIISIIPWVSTLISYFMVDLNQEKAEYFFYFIIVMMILSWIGNALGLVCGILLTDPRTSSALQPVFKLPFVLFSGFYKNRNDYASWIGWIQYISPFTFALEGLVINEFEGVDAPYDLKKAYGFNIGKWNCLYILIGLFLGFQAIAVISLYAKRGTLQ